MDSRPEDWKTPLPKYVTLEGMSMAFRAVQERKA